MLDINALKVLLEPVPDAAVGVVDATICLMNQAARDLVGDRTGERAGALLPQEVLEMDTCAIADTVIGGVRLCIQSASAGGVSLYYLSRAYDKGASPISGSERERGALFSELSTLMDAVRDVLLNLEGEHGAARTSASKALRSSCIVSRALVGGAAVEYIEKGDIVPQLERVSASSLGEEIVNTVRYFAQPKGIEVAYGGGKDVYGTFDVYWTEVALFNILSNCLIRIGSGGSLTLSVQGTPDRVTFTVDAAGPPSGEAGDEQGLRIARAIAALHGGTCIGNNAIEGESHFRVSLPVAETGDDGLRAAQLTYGKPDNMMVLTQLSAWLKADDYDPKLLD